MHTVYRHYWKANTPVPVFSSFLPHVSAALLWQLFPPPVLSSLALASLPPAAAAEPQDDAPPPSPLVLTGHAVAVALPPDVDAAPPLLAFAVVDVPPPPPAIADDAVELFGAPLFLVADADVAVLPDVDVLLSPFADVDVAALLLADVCDAALVPPSGPVDADVAQSPGGKRYDTCITTFIHSITIVQPHASNRK